MQHSEVIRKIIEITEQDEILYGLFQDYGNEEFAGKNVRQNRQTMNMSFNGFIYEAKINGQSVLEFIAVRYADRFSLEEDQYLKKIRNNFYGLFEIIAVDYGSGLTLRDVRTENIYKIAEHKGAIGTNIGTLIFCRLSDMGGIHIILYHDFALGVEEAYSVKRTFRTANIPLSTAKVAQLFFEENELTNEDGSFINPEKQLKRMLKKYFGKKFKLKMLEEKLLDAGENVGVFVVKFLEENVKRIPSHEIKKLEELLIAYRNSLTERNVEIGVLEKMIMRQLFTEIQEYFGCFDKDYEVPSRNEISKFADSWINTVQKELSGKTPKEVVEKERMDAGNVEKFAPEISIGKSEGFNPVMAKNKIALNHMKNQDPKGALPIFEELAAEGEEHEALFFNIGSCYKAMYVMAGCQEVKLLNAAVKWLEKALKLNRDHELSKKYLVECEQLLLMRRMEKGFRERKKIMIPVDKISEMSIESLEKELTSRIQDFNKEEFLELAMAAKDAYGVSDTYFDEERIITHGIDEDNIYPLLIEYWQRFHGDNISRK